MRWIPILAILLLLAMPFRADMAAPPPPDVFLHFLKNGMPEPAITNVMYECTNAAQNVNSSFVCNGGECNNTGLWSYDECNIFMHGDFTYQYGGQTMKTGTFDAPSRSGQEQYDIYIDAPTGNITAQSDVNPSPSGPCPPAFLAFGILVGIALIRM